jgi:hypothetical protein
MAKPKNPAAMDHIVASLKKDKNASYADIKTAADKKGLTIFPVMFGRAKLLLGYVKAAPRGTGRWAQAKAAKAAAAGMPPPAKRGPGRPRKYPLPVATGGDSTSGAASGAPTRSPGRPRKNPLPTSNGAVDSLVAAVQQSQDQLGRFRALLESIHSQIGEALA